jgi:hypothetical protein
VKKMQNGTLLSYRFYRSLYNNQWRSEVCLHWHTVYIFKYMYVHMRDSVLSIYICGYKIEKDTMAITLSYKQLTQEVCTPRVQDPRDPTRCRPSSLWHL